MNNQTTYNRAKHNKKHPYDTISKKLIRDKRLNATAVGLMSIILSNSDSYIINRNDILNRSNLNSNQFKVTWKMLMDYKYIVAIYEGNHKWSYIINEEGDQQEVTGNSLQEVTGNLYKEYQ